MIALSRASAAADAILFEKRVRGIGCLALRALQPEADAALLHDWVSRDYARFWNMGDKSRAEVAAFYARMMASGHATACVGLCNGEPAFLIELYDPTHDQVAGHYPVRVGDRGMHFLVAPPSTPIPGFTYAVLLTIMDFIFSEPAARRVVVEPDVRNDKIHVLNKRVGFLYDREIQLTEKRAHLAFCTRERFAAALLGGGAR